MADVLVTDGEERAVLAAIRGLADAGHRVVATNAASPAASTLSRLVAARHRTPDPRVDGERFVERVAALVAAERPDVLLPGAEASLLRISAARDRFEPSVALGLPPHEVVVRALDRVAFTAAAERAGLVPPRTIDVDDVDAAVRAADDLGWPVLVKPHRSAVPAAGDRMQQRPSRPAADEAALRALAPGYGSPFSVQEHVTGAVLSFGGVAARGRVLGLCASRYIRTFPPTGGSASFTETFDPSPELVESIERLLGDLEWEGLFELEAVERVDGVPAPIDFNPRPYGSMTLAVSSGANLPALWVAHVLGEHPKPVLARARHHYRWEEAELRNAVALVRAGRTRAAVAMLRPTPRTAHAMFRVSDPLPILARPLTLLLRPLRRRAAASA